MVSLPRSGRGDECPPSHVWELGQIVLDQARELNRSTVRLETSSSRGSVAPRRSAMIRSILSALLPVPWLRCRLLDGDSRALFSALGSGMRPR